MADDRDGYRGLGLMPDRYRSGEDTEDTDTDEGFKGMGPVAEYPQEEATDEYRGLGPVKNEGAPEKDTGKTGA